MVDETSNFRQEEITNDVFSILRNIYGFNLSEEALAEMYEGTDAVIKSSEILRNVKLENSDEPATIFRPYEGDSL